MSAPSALASRICPICHAGVAPHRGQHVRGDGVVAATKGVRIQGAASKARTCGRCVPERWPPFAFAFGVAMRTILELGGVVFVVGVMVLEGAQQGGHLQRGERSRPKPVTPFQVRPRASHHPPSAVRAPRAVVAGRRRGKELSSAALADAQEGRSDLGRISITESRFSICPWPVARVARVVSLCGESR
jgi:hypothetical protein